MKLLKNLNLKDALKKVAPGVMVEPVPGQDALRAGETTLQDDLAPSDLELKPDSFRMGNIHGRVYFIYDLPAGKTFDPTLLYHFPAQTWMSQFIWPEDEAQVREALKRRRTVLAASRIDDARQGRLGSFTRDRELGGAEAQLAELELQGETVYQMGWYIAVFASDAAGLDETSRRFEDALKRADASFYRASSLQEQGIHSLLPTGTDRLRRTRNMTSRAIGGMFPFVRKTYYEPERGMHLGVHRHTGTWVVLDPFASEVANGTMVVLGQSGRGKSTFFKSFVDTAVPLGHRVFAIDLENEFRPLCDDLGGVYIDMTRRGGNTINVLDLNPLAPDAPGEGLSVLKGFIRVAIGRKLSEIERNVVIHNAYMRLLRSAGIDFNNPATWGKPAPLLSDFVAELRNVEQKQIGEGLAACLIPYTEGLYGQDFDRPTNVDVHGNPLVVFGLRGVSEDMLPLRIWQIQNFVWSHVIVPGQRQPTHVIVDEGWHLLRHEGMVADLAAMARRFRKYYAALYLATHFVEDMLRSPDAKAICDTADMVVLFGQKPSAVESLGALFGLNKAEMAELPRMGRGEAILIRGQTHIPLYVPVPPERAELYSTSPKRE